MVDITLSDGKVLQFEHAPSVFDVAQKISEGLARQAIAGKLNNEELIDLTTTITSDSTLQIITSKDTQAKDILNHTTAHVFAQAVMRLFSNAKITIGPPVENGFWYDVDCDDLQESDLPIIEEEMRKIIKEDLEIKREFKTIDEARDFFKDNEYKLEIIQGIVSHSLNEDEQLEGSVEHGKLQFYTQKEFSDLCKGPHLPRTGLIKAFKLEKMTKAYWRGNSENKQLNRVYGAAFWKKSEMDEYYAMLEEAKKRDHRIVGKKLKLFMTHEYAPGMAFFLPKGFTIYKELQYFVREQYRKHDFKEVMTPNMFNKKLWETSGHWEHYKDDMFIVNVDETQFSLKPMNCPSHCLIFKNEFKSYRDLPIRIADFGALHRNELSGALSGLIRVRKFCQDDAHIFCTQEQIVDEIDKALQLVDFIYKDTFKMEYEIELSTRPEGKLGSDGIWDLAEKALEDAIKRNGKEYQICAGDGAFYGPKIDFRIRDCLGRIHQTATIQLDFNLPERFDLTFENKEGHSERPVMIHRAVLGSVERFMAIMIEHFAGKFPLWLSPNQIKIIPVADRHQEYCNQIYDELFKRKFRVEKDYSHEGVGKKIAMARESEMPNYMLILGDEDIKNNTISVRTRKFVDGKNEEFTTTLEDFITKIEEERERREITY
ncbi:MAG: threonine--tRNA ligase [Nanoarchaeota archaeon]|nr:threonine--tRNA ligase [Nanoarchaeota archaeon]